jgi:protein-tyrosine phosphatase
MRALIDDAGLSSMIEIDSAGTGDWHIGERADRRTIAALSDAGYDASAHRAQQFDPHWFAERDLVIALDRGHLRTLRSWASSEHDREKIRLLRSFDPSHGPVPAPAESDIADPYYAGMSAFTTAVTQIEESCRGLLLHLQGITAGRIAG